MFAAWGSRALVAQLSTSANRVFLDVPLDWRVMAFTAAITIATAVLFGAAPAFQAARVAPIDVLKEDGRGARIAMVNALRDAKLAPEAVQYLNAHATSTPLGDIAETVAIKHAFGDHAAKLAVSSTKSMHGHTLGASGALEAAATVLALETRVLPPTANFLEPDPDCPLDCVPNEAREVAAKVALSSSFAFGGLNAVLAFGSSSP